jgi:hypothetical protein
LETHRVVVPGYSFLQDVVSQVLADERRRLTTILERTQGRRMKSSSQ